MWSGGPGGLTNGQSETGTFSLIFGSETSSLNLEDVFARYQSVGGQVLGADGITIVNFGNMEDSGRGFAVPGPVAGAGLPGLVMALGGIVAWRQRRRQAA